MINSELCGCADKGVGWNGKFGGRMERINLGVMGTWRAAGHIL